MNAHAIPSLIRGGYPPPRDRHPWPLQYRRVASLNRIQKNQGAEQILLFEHKAPSGLRFVFNTKRLQYPHPLKHKNKQKMVLGSNFSSLSFVVGRIFSAFRALGFWMRPGVLPRDFLRKSKCLYTWFPDIWVFEGGPACYPGKFFEI